MHISTRCKTCFIAGRLINCFVESVTVENSEDTDLNSLAKTLMSLCLGMSQVLIPYFSVQMGGRSTVIFTSPWMGTSLAEYFSLAQYEGRAISEEEVYRFSAVILWLINQIIRLCRTSLLICLFAEHRNLSLSNFCLDEFGALRFRLNLIQTLRNMLSMDSHLKSWPRTKGSELGIYLKPAIARCILQMAFPNHDLNSNKIEASSNILSQLFRDSGRSQLFCHRMERLLYLLNKDDVTLSHLLHTNLFKKELETYWMSFGQIMDSNDSTPLIDAVRANDLEKVNELYGRQAGMTTCSKKTALMIAAARGNQYLTSLLTLREANYKDIHGNYATIIAIKNGHKDVALQLAAFEEPLLKEDGFTDLMFHVLGKDMHTPFQTIIKDAGRQMRGGLTALMIAALLGDLDYVLVLVKQEAGLRTTDGKTAGTLASELGHNDIAALLSRYEVVINSDGTSQLHRAVLDNDEKAVEETIHAAGEYTKDGYTALALAAKNHSAEIIKMLIPHEAGLRCKFTISSNGFEFCNPTALAVAVFHGHERAVNLLKRHEAGLAMEPNQATVMMLAAACGNSEMISLLHTREANHHDVHGNTALMYAVIAGSLDVVRKLIKYESKGVSAHGCTALMCAAQHNKVQMVTILMKTEEGLVDANGDAAIVYAARFGSVESLKLLFKTSEAAFASRCSVVIESSTFATAAEKRAMLRYLNVM